MSLNQLLKHQNDFCQPWKHIKVHDIDVCDTITADEGDFQNVDTVTINGQPYPPANPPVPLPLIANKVLRTNSTATTVLWGEVPHGSANQVFTTNSLGTAPQWSNSLDLPGALTVSGITTLNGVTNLTGDLRFNNLPGSVGQYLKKTGAATQAFSTLVPGDITAGADYNVLTSFSGTAQWYPQPQIKRIIYGTYFTAQDINSAAGPTALSFDTTPFTNVATSTTTPIVGISQPSATQFTVGNINNYVITIAGYINSASTGLGNSIVTLSLEIDGVEQQAATVVCNGDYSFSGSFPPITINASQVLRILARRVVGTNTLNTNAFGAALPNFASTISIISL